MPRKITLVGTDRSDDTLRTRRHLESRGIPYDFVDIEETGVPEDEVHSTRTVPQVEICGALKRLTPPDDDDDAGDETTLARWKVKN